jgi:Tfp pilus assembly protein PilN
MIKINLLGAPKPKRGKRAATATVDMGGGGGGNPVLMAVGAVVVAVVIVLGLWYAADSTAKRIKQQMDVAESENRRLASVKAKFDQEQKVKENYERRVKVIDELRSNQAGPVNLLTMIGDTVNNTDAVWLNVMQDTGATIRIEGTALSASAVANLIHNLEKTGYFKSVEMTETLQDAQAKDMQAFVFNLVCEKPKL